MRTCYSITTNPEAIRDILLVEIVHRTNKEDRRE
jgi:hypothetical protein